MAFTGKNIVPIVDGGAGLGSATKGWGGAFITNVTTSSATQGGKLVLSADDGAVMASGHRLGVIEFKGAEDTASTLTIGARIEALADATWSASENGASLKMYTTDANASESLVLTLDSDKKATFTGVVDLSNATTSSATQGGKLNLISDDGAALGDDHQLGKVGFWAAEDTGSTLREGASIRAFADAAWSAMENGTRLEFRTMDGNASSELALTLDSDRLATFTNGVLLNNTAASHATAGGILRLRSDDGAAMGDDHQLGAILFQAAEDSSNNTQTGASIRAYADAAWSDTVNDTRLEFYTMDSDASSELALTLDSDRLATFTNGVLLNNAATSSATAGGILKLRSDDGATMADDHRLGGILFQGAEDGSNNFATGASISAYADATWSDTENGGRLVFTTTDGDASASTVLTLDSDKLATFTGNVEIAASGNLSFGGVDIIDDSSGTTTLKNIDALDATTIATIEDAVEANIDTLNGSITIDTDRTADQGEAGAENITALHVDFDRIIPTSGTYAHNDRGIDLDVTSSSLGTSSLYGMDIDVVGRAFGTSIAYGIDLTVSGSDTNIGAQIQSTGTHLKLVAAADPDDYATFTVADTGDLTIATVGDGTRDSDLILDVDGQMDIKVATDKSCNILNETTSSATQGGLLNLRSDDGAALGDDHRLGRLAFQAAEDTGSTFRQGASIQAFADAAWSDTVNDTRLEFYTMDGDNNQELSLTLDSDKLATFTGQIMSKDTTTSSSAGGGGLRLLSDDGAALEDDHKMGYINFQAAEDGSGTLRTGASIAALADAAWSDTENGTRLEFHTMDGNASRELSLTLDSDLLATFAGAVTVTGDLTVNGDTVTFESANADDPIVTIKNTSNDVNDMASLNFVKDRGAAATAGTNLAEIYFTGEDADQNAQEYGRILCEIGVATGGQESGILKFGVANHDGGSGYGLILTGGSEDDEIDVTVGLGADSVTTVAGNLVVTGSTVIKVLPHHFMSNEDGGANKSAQFRDDTIIGVRATHNDAELYAFVEIPFGKTATSVTVYGNDSGNVVEVFESDINAGALTDKTHGSGCVVGSACDITDVAADTTNYLVIKVTITSYTNDMVYGAAVTIANT